MKLYMVELTTYAVVLAKDERDAIRVADCCVAEICGDNYPEAWHAREIQSEDDLSDGWNSQCLPYNGDGSTRISDYLKGQTHER